MMTARIPVALFVYARPEHTRRTLAALRRNHGAAETDVVVFSDAPADSRQAEAVAAVRKVVRELVTAESGFRSCRLVARDSHLGLANSVIGGVSDVLQEREAVIVLEDDLVTVPHFLEFMNLGLRTYQDRPDILSVCGCHLPGFERKVPADYPWPVWCSKRHLSHGWGTWAASWTEAWARVAAADLEDLERDADLRAAFDAGGCDLSAALLRWRREGLDLWAVRFSYAHFLAGAWSVVPRTGYVKNIGYDGSGANCMWNPLRRLPARLADTVPQSLPADLQADPRLLAACRKVIRRRNFFEQLAGSWVKRGMARS